MQTVRAFGATRPAGLGRAPVVSRRTLVVRAAVPAQPVTVKGSGTGDMELALAVAPEETAKGLVHRYLVYVRQNARQGTASTKTRSEVRGGGKKPFKQKGSGQARRGSSTSPLFPGGGVSFGPKPKDWSIKMNKKERRLALATAVQSAAADTIVVDSISSDGKTKSLLEALAKAGAPADKKTLLVTASLNEMALRAGRNVDKLEINTAGALRVFDVLNADVLVFEKAALEKIQQLYGPKAAEASA